MIFDWGHEPKNIYTNTLEDLNKTEIEKKEQIVVVYGKYSENSIKSDIFLGSNVTKTLPK